MNNPRAAAAVELAKVIGKGQAFDGTMADFAADDPRHKSLAREICYGTLRHYPLLKAHIDPLLKKPLAKKDADVYALLLSAVYQLRFMEKPEHAVINSAVEATRSLKKAWAKGLVNAVLRNWLRTNKPDSSLNEASQRSHPDWLYQQIRRAWPDHAEQIIRYNNHPPPMTLRLSPALAHEDYLAALTNQQLSPVSQASLPLAVTLEKAAQVEQLPGFATGQVSVQDAGAQWAAILLDLQPGYRLLDACAAPGGKSIHALQLQPDIKLVALDHQQTRLEKLERDLDRCGINDALKSHVSTYCEDANQTERWWDQQQFDRILVDAPCSGTGIISHHPDIKLLRRPDDLQQFAAQQNRLLTSLWPLLKEGGKLLYCTCSIMPEENDETVRNFVNEQRDAVLDKLDLPPAIKTDYGYQLLPNAGKNGGFFYARLSKHTKL